LRSLLRTIALFVASAAVASATAAELKWQPGRTPRARSAAKQTAQFQRRQDAQVRRVDFEEEVEPGPRLASGGEGRAKLRSIVVAGEKEPQGLRSAQLPATGGGLQPTTPPDSRLEEELRAPFGDLPTQQPQLDTPDLEPPPGLDDDGGPLELDEIDRPPTDEPPRTFQPIPGPDRSTLPSTLEPETEQERESPVFDPQTAKPEDRQESCNESLTNLRAYTIDKVNLSIGVDGTAGEDFPYECGIDDGSLHAGRSWPQTTYMWKASALCHKPLYFENEQLERYGHSWPPCCQPFVSGAHFFTRLPVLPYCMGVEPPTECVYALGHYRPGNCAPYMCDPIPFSWRGAFFQAGAVVGAAAVLP
jgi:hypothetical protein